MSGRKIFEKLARLIDFAVFIFSLLGKGNNERLLLFFRDMPSKMGIFLRYLCLRNCAARCGNNVAIMDHVILKNVNKLVLGDNVSIHQFCYLDAVGGIEICHDVSVAHGSMLVSFNHGYKQKDVPIKYQPICKVAILVGNNTWIGARAVVLAGSTIGNGCIVAANATCTAGIIADDTIVGGTPARTIGMRK